MAEIAFAEPPRAAPQRRDRNQHPPRQDRAGRDRDREPERDQQRDAHQLIPDRRQRLRRRLFEEHEPAEFGNGARRGQDRVAIEVLAGGERRAARLRHGVDLRGACERLADLGPLARTRQHLAVRIDHIGEGRLADLGVAEEIRHEAQIDFGDGDPGIEAGMRHRDRHEGAGVRGKSPARN